MIHALTKSVHLQKVAARRRRAQPDLVHEAELGPALQPMPVCFATQEPVMLWHPNQHVLANDCCCELPNVRSVPSSDITHA